MARADAAAGAAPEAAPWPAEAAPWPAEAAPWPAAQARPARRSNPLSRWLAPLAAVGYFLAKFKGLLVLLKFGKVALSFVTMALSVWAYAAAWHLELPAAIGFVLLIFIHEMGHWIAFRLKGVPAGAPVFIPLFGAFVQGRGALRSATDMGEVALAGPLAGTAASFACLGLGALLGGPLWPLLAMLGFYLNLFNLLPIGPLDGGQIARAVSPWLWLPGLAGLVYLFVQHGNPLLLGIGIVGGIQMVGHLFRRKPAGQPAGYDNVRVQDRIILGLLYFALVALLALTMVQNPVFSWGSL